MPRSKDSVARELRQTGCQFLSELHVNSLAGMLASDEQIIKSIIGVSAGEDIDLTFISNYRVGSIVVKPKKFLYPEHIERIWTAGLTEISNIEPTMVNGKIICFAIRKYNGDPVVLFSPESRRRLNIKPPSESDILSFYHTVQNFIIARDQQRSAVQSHVGQGSDVVSQLERLNALRSAGALTDQEYETIKRRLIGQ